MTDKEKLIDLLDEVHHRHLGKEYLERLTTIADYLIANGVTLQRWIPVTERLPEVNTTVIVSDNNGTVFQCLYAYDGWDLWEGNEVNITHWQPMPQPPKEE